MKVKYAEISVDDFRHPLKNPPLKVRLEGRARKIGGGSRTFTVKNFVSMVPSNSDGDKVALLEDLKFEDGTEELRVCYYIIGRKGRLAGKWAWGQFALFIPSRDFVKLIEKGKEKGII